MLAALELLGDRVFWSSLGSGVLAAAMVALVGRVRPRRSRALLPVAGAALVVPAIVMISDRYEMPGGAVLGLLLLGGAGILLDVQDEEPGAAALVAVPGAWVLAWHGDLVPVTWIRLVVLGTCVLGGAAFASFDRRWGQQGYPPLLFALTAAGVYYTVPDPYEALVLLGCALPVALLGWPRPLARFGATGAFMASGLLAWTVAQGGFGRQSSIIGGVACLGLLVLEPIGRLWSRGWSPLAALPLGWARWPLVSGAHLVLVLVASRVAGVRSPMAYEAGAPLWRGAVGPALAIVIGEVVVALAVVEALRHRRRHARLPRLRDL